MKVVLDTNVYISGLLFKGGTPSRLIDLARDKKFELFYSPEILQELNEVMELKFDLNLHERNRLIHWLEECGTLVYPDIRVKWVRADDDDNRILECALFAQADYLVSGDKHLLNVKQKLDFKIVTPAEFYGLFLQT